MPDAAPTAPRGVKAGTAAAARPRRGRRERLTADALRDRTLKTWRGLVFSSLTRHILAINILVLAVPIGGVFYLNQYQDSLITAQVAALRVQAQIFAGALGGGAVQSPAPGTQQIDVEQAQELLRRLIVPTATRARLFDNTGALIVDTRTLSGISDAVRVEELPPPSDRGISERIADAAEAVLDWLPGRTQLPLYEERRGQTAFDYHETRQALVGEAGAAIRDDGRGGILLSIAVPVQRYKQVLGAVMVTTPTTDLERRLRAVRLDILKVFGIALAVTVMLSLYLGGTIARPIRRLAAVAERVRRAKGRQVEIPDLSHRRDEIGELSRALREMTFALWARMDAIERFAADVAHELKNPLTSLRSAVETVAKVSDPAQQKRLMAIILEDVQRLDRLISDVSEMSRLDAELSRHAPAAVDLAALLSALVGLERTARDGPDMPSLLLDLGASGPLTVLGVEGRLGQVFRNVIQNAISFSPPGGRIEIRARRQGAAVRVTVEDEGPGIPEGKLEAIFDRFYTDRPQDRTAPFGRHSGLGLSISRQIVQASGGRIWAENRHAANGAVAGARFVVELAAVPPA